MNVTLKQISFISSNIPGWFEDKKLKENCKEKTLSEEVGMALYIWYTVRLCGRHCLSLPICSVSLFPYTVWLCEAEGKELTVSCQQQRHQKGLFGRSWGAWAHRIAAGITQGEMLLLQGWFRTIMEKLCGGFSANHPDAHIHMHTHKAYIIYIWTSLRTFIRTTWDIHTTT